MAGFDRIPEIFGHKTTSTYLSEGNLEREKAILNMDVYTVYTELQIRSWIDHCTRNYDEIMKNKKR